MISNQMLEEILNYPANDKIELVEKILVSLKADMSHKPVVNKASKFRVRKISLGQEVNIDRNTIYDF